MNAGEAGGVALGVVLAAVAGVRRGKAVHPAGAVHRAELKVSGSPHAPRGSSLLATPGRHPAIVRFSRSVGMPRPLPDLLGMSLRVLDCYGLDAHQDLLMVTSADHPLGHFVFLPAADVWQRPYSSSLPYRAGADRFLIGALPEFAGPRPDGEQELERLNGAAARGSLRFQLAVAAVRGRFRSLATLQVGARLSPALDALRFNPWNTGGGLEPAGWLNETRRRSYSLSQAAWARTRHKGRQAQEAAEAELAREMSRQRLGAGFLDDR